MTIIRLQGGGLWIHSPIPWSEELDNDVCALGQIEFIVAPSCFHHMFVDHGKNIIRYQNLRPKRSRKNDLICRSITLQNDCQTLWDDIDCIEIQGMPFVQEHLFFHRDSQTLL